MSGGWVFSSELSASELSDVQAMIAANGLPAAATTAGEELLPVDDATGTALDGVGPGFATTPDGATVIRGPAFDRSTAGAADDADAAFQRLMAANPNATVIGGPPSPGDGDAAFAALVAANPGATVIGGGASSGTGTTSGADDVAPATGTWRFSSDLSPERLAQFQAMVGMQGAGAQKTAEEEAAEAAAAETAFATMLAANPGAREIAPGVFACEE